MIISIGFTKKLFYQLILKSFLTNSYIEFIRRQANEIAHILAKTATFSFNFCIFDEISTCITDLVFNEMI